MTFPDMDFPNAQPPSLTPLQNSFTADEIENDLRNIFIELFTTTAGADNITLAAKVFDANVLGMAHLGSYELVKRIVNLDGLFLPPGPRAEALTRYVYRAWKARNKQGRGLFFIRTYLQLLYPGRWRMKQQMQDKALPYPTALSERTDEADNDPTKFLTSRLVISIDVDAGDSFNLDGIIPIITPILPARFVPFFAISIGSSTGIQMAAVGTPVMMLRSYGTCW